MKRKLFTLIFLFSFSLLYSQSRSEELRGVWVVTAYNLDWPRSAILSSEEQKRTFIELLDYHQSYGINALFVQVRPSGETFYPSRLEPWSHWLTGKQGRAPSPYYDPLQFMIDECHKRNMEFHAWVNPFRAVSNVHRVIPSASHITNKQPSWFHTYNDQKFFDPGNPAARTFIIRVVMDMVDRYNIDGVHFDDYFYPLEKGGIPFPDEKTYRRYNKSGLSKGDWRRQNIDHLIQSISDSINLLRPLVQFGISPVGVWRNRSHDPTGSNTRGLSAYDDLHADILKWLRNGWIDYVAPQLYWYRGYSVADYDHLVDWWSKNTYGRFLYIGQAAHFVNSSIKWSNPSEIPNQIRYSRKSPAVKGNIFYSSKWMQNNPNGLTDSLRYNLYSQQAYAPKMFWKEPVIVAQMDSDVVIVEPEDTIRYYSTHSNSIRPYELSHMRVGREHILSWELPGGHERFIKASNTKYIIYRFDEKETIKLSKDKIFAETREPYLLISTKFSLFKKRYRFVVTSINQYQNESKTKESIRIKLGRLQ